MIRIPPGGNTSLSSRLRHDPTLKFSPTQQSSNTVLAINISFPEYLRPAPASSDVSEIELLEKVSRLYEFIDPELGCSASNSKIIFGSSYLNIERALSDCGIVSGGTILLSPVRRVRRLAESLRSTCTSVKPHRCHRRAHIGAFLGSLSRQDSRLP